MNKVGKLVISISLSCAIIVSLVFFTLAWFASTNSYVTASGVTLYAGRNSMTLQLVPFLGEKRYAGQTGNNNLEDAPYKARYNLTFLVDSEEHSFGYFNIKLTMPELNIFHHDYMPATEYVDEQNVDRLTEEQIAGNFTYRFETDGYTFGPDESNLLYCMDGDARKYLYGKNGDTLTGVLYVIYLGESNYSNYLLGNYSHSDVPLFQYSSTDYMDARFDLSFVFSTENKALPISQTKHIAVVNDDNYSGEPGQSSADCYSLRVGVDIANNTAEPVLVKPSLKAVRIWNGGNYEMLTTAQLAGNFTLQAAVGGIVYDIEPETGFMYRTSGLITDYYRLSPGVSTITLVLNYCPPQTFAAGVGTPFALTSTAGKHYSIEFALDSDVSGAGGGGVAEITTLSGASGSFLLKDMGGYDSSKTGTSNATLYTTAKDISYTSSSSASGKKLKMNISAVSIKLANGTIQNLSASQIENTFALRASIDGSMYHKGSSSFDSYNGRLTKGSLDTTLSAYLSLDSNHTYNIGLSLVYQKHSNVEHGSCSVKGSPSAIMLADPMYDNAEIYFSVTYSEG